MKFLTIYNYNVDRSSSVHDGSASEYGDQCSNDGIPASSSPSRLLHHTTASMKLHHTSDMDSSSSPPPCLTTGVGLGGQYPVGPSVPTGQTPRIGWNMDYSISTTGSGHSGSGRGGGGGGCGGGQYTVLHTNPTVVSAEVPSSSLFMGNSNEDDLRGRSIVGPPPSGLVQGAGIGGLRVLTAGSFPHIVTTSLHDNFGPFQNL